MSGDPVRSRRFAVGFVAVLAVIAGIAVVVHQSNASHSVSAHVDVLDEARATTVAAALLNRSSAPTEATSVSDAPVPRLAKAPQVPDARGLIVRARFWTIGEGLNSAYGATQANLPSDVALTSNGNLPGSPAESFTSDAVRDPPYGIDYDQLIVAAVALSPDSTGIAEYAEVAPRPTLNAQIAVPLGVTRVTITTNVSPSSTSGDLLPAGRTRSASFSATTARRFAEAIDVLHPASTGPTTCPSGPGASSTVTLVDANHAWRAIVDSCQGVALSHSGGATIRLSEGAALGDLLTTMLAPGLR